jgi:hypothetical protein
MMFVGLFLAIIFAVDAVRYDGYQVYQVGPLLNGEQITVIRNLVDNDERLRQVVLLSDVISNKVPVDLVVSPEVVDRFREILNQNGIQFSVVDTDLQKTFDSEMLSNRKSFSKYAADIQQFAHDAYLQYDEQVAWLESAVAESSIAELISIGTSYEGRELWVLSINADNTALPAIFIDSGIHAREWIAPATVLWIIDEILTGTSSDAEYLRSNYRWYFLPNVNPDGYQYTWIGDRLWRKTRSPNPGSICIGTDGNRNWDYNWCGEGASPQPCSDTYCGSSAFSERETAAQRDFLLTIKDFTNLFISVHAYSELWLLPWGGSANKPDDYDELVRIGNLARDAIQSVNGKVFTVGTPPDILYVATGGSFDWVKATARIEYAYSPELRPATAAGGGFQIPASNIIPSGREIFAAINACARNVIHKL